MVFSPTYVSALVIVIVAVLNLFKVNVSQTDIESIITPLVTAIAGIIVLYRRYQKGDLTLVGKIK